MSDEHSRSHQVPTDIESIREKLKKSRESNRKRESNKLLSKYQRYNAKRSGNKTHNSKCQDNNLPPEDAPEDVKSSSARAFSTNTRRG